MLATALRCFQGASRCECDSDEEEWLIHYMLGKIAEKRRQAPGDYLHLYQKVPAPLVGGRRARLAYLLRCVTLTGCLFGPPGSSLPA